MSRPTHTLLLLSGTDALVFDRVGRGARASLRCERAEAPLGSWVDRVGAVLAQRRSLGRRVWILDTEIWTGSVELPSTAVSGLPDTEIARAAAFEVESLTGLAAAASSTAVLRGRRSRSPERFLVVQAARADVDAVTRLVRSRRAKLVGIGHPAALDGPLDPAHVSTEVDRDDASWRRVELWPQGVFVLERHGSQRVVHPLHVPPDGPWQRSVDDWSRSGPAVAHEEILVAPGIAVPESDSYERASSVPRTGSFDDSHPRPEAFALHEPSSAAFESGTALEARDDAHPSGRTAKFALDDDDTLEAYGEAWLEQLTDTRWRHALLRPARREARHWPKVAVGVGLAGVMAALCIREYRSTDARAADLRREISLAEGPASELAALRREIQQLQPELKRTRQESEALAERHAQERRRSAAAEGPRRRIASLLPVLAEAAGPELLIRSIESEGSTCRVRGVARSTSAISNFAERIGRTHTEPGLWRADTPTSEPVPNARLPLWSFDLEIHGLRGNAEDQPLPEGSASLGGSAEW